MAQMKLGMSTKSFDCNKLVEPHSCKKCSFSSHFLKALIEHKKGKCERTDNKSNFLLNAYKCQGCQLMSCSCLVTIGHESECLLEACTYKNDTSFWTCSHCEVTISYKDYKRRADVFLCGECDYFHSNFEELKLHAFFMHLSDECLKCFFANDDQGEPIINNKSSDGSPNRSCKVERRINPSSCGECVRNKYSPAVSMKLFVCEVCGYKSRWKGNVSKHINAKHAPVGNFKWFACDLCEFKSKMKSNLSNHKLTEHTSSEDIKWFVCDTCGFKTKWKSSLTKHNTIFKHTPIGRPHLFACDQSSDGNSNKSCKVENRINLLPCDEPMRRHKRSPAVNTKWHLCDVCGYKNRWKSNVSRHMTRAHVPVDNFKFACDKCEYTCKLKSSLNQHQFSKHIPPEDVKWFLCGVCGFKSRWRGAFAKHINLKHGSSDMNIN